MVCLSGLLKDCKIGILLHCVTVTHLSYTLCINASRSVTSVKIYIKKVPPRIANHFNTSSWFKTTKLQLK